MNETHILNLDKQKEVEKTLEEYLKLECPSYIGKKFISMKQIADYTFEIFQDLESRVLVYDVDLEEQTKAFGTIGGMLYPKNPPYSNVFANDKRIPDAVTAAKMHLYWEGINRYPNFFKKEENLDRLADSIDLPKELR